jgi:tetratricopeptide (TPR) repeat protein
MDITQFKHEADIYLQQGDFTAAINLYEKCIELAPNLINNYWYLGLAWLLQGNEIESQSIWLSTFTRQ